MKLVNIRDRNKYEELLNLESHNKDTLFEVLNLIEVDLLKVKEMFEVKKTIYSYDRYMIYNSNKLAILLLYWYKGLECLPHDHNVSFGAVTVFEGSGEDVIYIKQGEHYLEKSIAVKKGERFFTEDDFIHKMRASPHEDLITLHVYAPPINGMRIFDFELQKGALVSSDCGAWWPEDKSQILNLFELVGAMVKIIS